MQQTPVTVGELMRRFHFVQVSGDEKSLQREIKVNEINRPGPEILGYFQHTSFSRLQFIGHKEQYLVSLVSEDDQRDRFRRLLNDNTPAIIITQGYSCPPVLLEMAKELNFPILVTPEKTSNISVLIILYLNDRFAPSMSIHGSLIEVLGSGVLLLGESGIGKSEIALELIKRGHRLVADDRVDIVKSNDRIVGQAPDLLKGIIEVRGIGLIDAVRMFGITAIKDRQEIDYVIRLVTFNPNASYDRLGTDLTYTTLLDQPIPSIELPVRTGRNMSELIEVAVVNLRLKENGFDATREFDRRFEEKISGGNK